MPASASRAWRILGLGGAFILVSGGVRLIHGALVGVDNPLPSPADLLALGGYGLFIAAEVVLIRRRSHERNPDAWLDGVLIAAALGLILWALVLGPYVRSPEIHLA